MAINLQNVTLQISAGRLDQFPREPLPQIAFSGRSNVGKSSLLNALLGRKSLARVSSMPGKTITVNFYNVDRHFFFVDLPGYGFARRSPEEKQQWSAITDGYFTKNPNRDRLRLVLQLIDSRAGITDDDAMMIDWLSASNQPFAIVMTKADKLNKTDYAKQMENLQNDPRIVAANAPVLAFSALSGVGKNELWALLNRTLERKA